MQAVRLYGSGKDIKDIQRIVQVGISSIREWVGNYYGVVYRSSHSYTNLLKACGFSYQKAEKVCRSRPNEAALLDFEAEVEKTDRFLQDHPTGVILALDQMSLGTTSGNVR